MPDKHVSFFYPLSHFHFLLAMSQTSQNATFKSRLISFFIFFQPRVQVGCFSSSPPRTTADPATERREKRQHHLWIANMPPKSASRRTSTPSK
ncbi:hypothetical protein HZ326_21142 [Fusarium oxysporum f. sp. albedinis]|nr:hypothetical protein HZ326_21142 [Fusarium oxysporum f. sp. albedinis]